ncbi:MAG: hypothetical protein R3Y65_01275 [Bacillota bacterium]
MATYWKEVVNFGGEFGDIVLLLSVFDGEGRGFLDSTGKIDVGEIQLLVREGGFSHAFENGKCEFTFKTNNRDFCVRLYRGGEFVCGSGNSKNLKHEFAVPKILATDTFEAKVADFNYFETEFGEKGKNLESLLGEEKAEVCEEIEAKAEVIKKIEPKAEVIKEIETKAEIGEEISEEIETKEETKEETENVADIMKAESEETVANKPQQVKTAVPKQQNARGTANAKTQTANAKTQTASRKTQTASKNTGRKSAKEGDFFSLAKPQVEKMLAKFPKEEFLEDVLDNSRWVKVDFSKDTSYAVGLIYADDLVGYIGYGVVGKLDNPPKFENPQFVPFDITNPNGDGYFLIFQRADNGEKV